MEHSLSVIVPVYNAEQTIEKCVESLALGRLRDLQIILIDDGSTDSSWQCCQALARRFSQVQCIRSDTNRGVSHARNLGLEAATGEFVCFVDSDDWVSEHYCEALLAAAREHPDSLIACGLHFLNLVEDYRRTYLWETVGAEYRVAKADFFELHRKFLLPQLWNKIFRRSIMEAYHLRFDESLNMGEDFQFILAYLDASGAESCVVCNLPLYYYTRRSTNTLMRGFGIAQREAEFERYARLRDLTGAQEQYKQALERMRGSFVYHALRHSQASKQQQLVQIREITRSDNAESYFRQLQITKAKEAIVLGVRGLRQQLALKWGNFQRSRNRRTIEKAKTSLGVADPSVTLICQNCIAGIFYQDMGLRYDSPTVGLFLSGSDFVKLASDLPGFMAAEPELRWGEEYPIGQLRDIEIHFMHYDTCTQALQAWQRRRERIHWDRIVVLGTDRDGFTDADFAVWTQISCPKVLFTANKAYADHPDSLYFPEFQKQGCVGDLIDHRQFYRRDLLIQRIRNTKED